MLLDDRKASPGVKFKDAELLGVPTILVVGRGLDNGVVELRDRKSGERREVPVGEAVSAVRRGVGGCPTDGPPAGWVRPAGRLAARRSCCAGS